MAATDSHLTTDNQAQIQQLFMASTLHEIKNQLGEIMMAVDNLKNLAHLAADAEEAQQLDYQFQLLNFRLGQILQGYKQQEHYQLRLDDHDLADFFEEALIRHRSLQDRLSITVEPNIDFYPCFDEALLTNVLDTMIYNALQAGASQIHLSASHTHPTSTEQVTHEGGVWLFIEDNGPGFPHTLLDQPLNQLNPGDLRQNKSGLGLYMTYNILVSHQNTQEHGKMLLDNRSSLGGARVSLYLP